MAESCTVYRYRRIGYEKGTDSTKCSGFVLSIYRHIEGPHCIGLFLPFHFVVGYRDAECGWVMVTEENHQETDKPKSSLRTALFLVIYATRRGILEVTFLVFPVAREKNHS